MEESKKRHVKEEEVQCTQKTKRSRPKPKVTGEWGKDDVLMLIQQVEQQPCIWNYSLSDHKNLNMRDSAWRSVVKQFGDRYTANDCKAKWTNVKTAYQRALANYLKSTSGALPKWPYWSAMQFVGANEAANIITSDASITFTADQSSCDTVMVDSSSQANKPINVHPTGSGIAQRRSTLPLKSCSVSSIAEKSLKHATQVLDTFEKNSDDDEWQVVAKYWALQLRNIALGDPVSARRTHLAVSKLILDAALAVESQQVVEQSHIAQPTGSSQLQLGDQVLINGQKWIVDDANALGDDVVSDDNESISRLRSSFKRKGGSSKNHLKDSKYRFYRFKRS